MPSSATPSPLDQLAGIEQGHRDYAEWNERYAAHCDGTVQATEAREKAARHHSHAATLATLREVLAEWVGAHEASRRETPTPAMQKRCQRANTALRRALLTPDSPRQAGEEIIDG